MCESKNKKLYSSGSQSISAGNSELHTAGVGPQKVGILDGTCYNTHDVCLTSWSFQSACVTATGRTFPLLQALFHIILT